MYRDMKLITEILQAVRAEKALPVRDDYGVVSEHVRLAIEAGFLDATEVQIVMQPSAWFNMRVTWDGHNFLDGVKHNATVHA